MSSLPDRCKIDCSLTPCHVRRFGVLLVCVVLQSNAAGFTAAGTKESFPAEAIQKPGYGACQVALTVAIVPITLYVLYNNAQEIRATGGVHAREHLASKNDKPRGLAAMSSRAPSDDLEQPKNTTFDAETANPILEKDNM